MRLTRRNVLVVLGVLTIAGGTMFGAGAFSQVQADRTVTASTAADSSAYLTLESNSSYTGTQDDELTIDLTSLNGNATTQIDYAINVSANPADGSGSYDVYVQTGNGIGPNAALDLQDASTGDSIVGSGNAVNVGTTEQLDVSLRVDLTNGNSTTDIQSDVTFVAEEA